MNHISRLAVACLLLCGFGNAKANIIANGGFELEPNWGGGIGSDGSYTAFITNQIPDWTIVSGHAVTVHRNPGAYPTITGQYSVNTDGEGFNGHNADFYQDFATTPSGIYTLSFDWGGWLQSNGATNNDKLEVSVTDLTTNAVLFDGVYNYPGNQASGGSGIILSPSHVVSTPFAGNGHSLRLEIRENPESHVNDNMFMVDNFDVEQQASVVPVPPSAGLAGMGILSFLGYRRRLKG
jgi:hypothetical protein